MAFVRQTTTFSFSFSFTQHDESKRRMMIQLSQYFRSHWRIRNALLIIFLLHIQICHSYVTRFTKSSLNVAGNNHVHTPGEMSTIDIDKVLFEQCSPPFDQDIYDFYRFNFSKKRNKKRVPTLPSCEDRMEDDAIYVLRSPERRVLACLRLTRSKNDRSYTFLRSLCVSREYRGHGLGLRLLKESIEAFDTKICYCFAAPYLARLYERAGLSRIPKHDMEDSLPKWLVYSFNSMDARWSRKTLGLFLKQAESTRSKTEIVLLQHSTELSKKTATGWLLNDDLYHRAMQDNDSLSLGKHFALKQWIWSGREDTSRIEEQIKRSRSEGAVYLLWTGGSGQISNDEEKESLKESGVTYIILDGTWQQAKSMYRKIPILWELPRLSLIGEEPSQYVLRQDYTGWKERFRSASSGQELLCTAEVVAALLDRKMDDKVGGNAIRARLHKFQTAMLQNEDIKIDYGEVYPLK